MHRPAGHKEVKVFTDPSTTPTRIRVHAQGDGGSAFIDVTRDEALAMARALIEAAGKASSARPKAPTYEARPAWAQAA